MPDFHYALYHSISLLPPTADFHNDIMKTSQKNNMRDGLTGFLHREGDFFIQYLEGPKSELHKAMRRISRDPRHSDFTVMKQAPATRRLLPEWSMGFVDPLALSLSDLLDVSPGQLNIRALDPFDLVVFMVSNADALRTRAMAAVSKPRVLTRNLDR